MKIELSSLSFSYPNNSSRPILDRLNLKIDAANIVCFVGPSGCGKTTLLKIIGGLLKPTLGSINVDKTGIDEYRKNGGIGFCFQSPALLPWKNVRDNIALPFIVQKQKPRWDDIDFWIKKIGLSDEVDKMPHQLSGGMQQRVALARALVYESKLLLLDEPFAKLDEILKYELYSYVEEYVSQNSATLCFVTHDIAEAVQLSDHVFVFGQPPLRNYREHNVQFSRPRSIEIMADSAFAKLSGEVRRSLIICRSNE